MRLPAEALALRFGTRRSVRSIQASGRPPETGLYYNRFRHYDPLAGQYASPDPIGLLGGSRPQGYVHNPNGWVDPLGLASCQTVNHKPSGDLDWSRVNPKGEDALSHIMRHDADIPKRPCVHGVFLRNLTRSGRERLGNG